MEIQQWWPTLSESTKAWLMANNGHALPAAIVTEIVSAGGAVNSATQADNENGPEGFLLSDHATDWIEETSNDEA